MFSGSGVLLLHFQINDAVSMLVVLMYIINLHHKHVLFIFFIFLLKTKYQDSIKKKNMMKHEKRKTNIPQ